MDDIFEELYYQFVYLPKKDACPERTARWEPFFHGAPLDLVDAKDGLVYNASLTGFQEGFRLGVSFLRVIKFVQQDQTDNFLSQNDWQPYSQ